MFYELCMEFLIDVLGIIILTILFSVPCVDAVYQKCLIKKAGMLNLFFVLRREMAVPVVFLAMNMLSSFLIHYFIG